MFWYFPDTLVFLLCFRFICSCPLYTSLFFPVRHCGYLGSIAGWFVASFDGRGTVRVLRGTVSTLRHRRFGPPLSDHLQYFIMPHLVIVLKVSPEHWRSAAAIMDVWNNSTRLSFGSPASPPGRMPGRVVCLCVCLSWFPPPLRCI